MKNILEIQKLSYTSPSGRKLLNDLSLSMSNEKVGMVGRNGVGKSTLVKILMGEKAQDLGTYRWKEPVSFVPQIIAMLSVEDMQKKQDALSEKVKDSCLYPQIRKLILAKLHETKNSPMMSGGEQRLLYIMDAFMDDSNFVVMDEPESNLDIENRRLLIKLIRLTNKGLLVISHDSGILNEMNDILEFRDQGIRRIAGNFEAYKQVVNNEVSELDKKIKKTRNEINTIRINEIKAVHNQKYRMQKADDEMADKGYGDFWCDTPKKDRAMRTLKRLQKMYEEKQEEGKKLFDEYMDKATLVNNYKLPVPQVEVDPDIPIVHMEGCEFSYGEKTVVSDMNLTIYQGDRIAFVGPNGIGKTTLAKLIYGELSGIGCIERNWNYAVYLDQFVTCLNSEESLVENICNMYGAQEESVDEYIRKMGYPIPQAKRKTKLLSGGELIVAALLYLFYATRTPDLIILDEPVNHLDIAGVNILKNMLNSYKGTLLLVSHNEEFLRSINNLKIIDLSCQDRKEKIYASSI